MISNLFLENHAVNEILWKNIVEPNRHILQCGTYGLLARCLRLQAHTQSL